MSQEHAYQDRMAALADQVDDFYRTLDTAPVVGVRFGSLRDESWNDTLRRMVTTHPHEARRILDEVDQVS